MRTFGNDPNHDATGGDDLLQLLVVRNGGGSAMCPSQGGHWEAIGFQGNDPRTDLNRSMKMLSVLQVSDQGGDLFGGGSLLVA